MKEQTIKEALGDGIKFHVDLPRMEKEKLLAMPIVLFDARVVDDWDGDFGTTKFALLAAELEDGSKVTSLCGGKAVVRQVEKLLRLHKLPGRIRCFLNTVEGPNGVYYLLDSETPPAEAVKMEEKTEEAAEELFS